MKKFLVLTAFVVFGLSVNAHAGDVKSNVATSSSTTHMVTVSTGAAYQVDGAKFKLNGRLAFEIQNQDASDDLRCGSNQFEVSTSSGRIVSAANGSWSVTQGSSLPIWCQCTATDAIGCRIAFSQTK